MAGFSWPSDLGIFQDIADKFFSDADESELRPIADEHKSLADQLPDQLYDGDDAYNELEDAY
ncbi:hypothetical protein Srot_1524 [Segniliparus rotundus DSM 44985]|nr:hypothetical protein [Segniliparus rotundus]ADG97987.1 hypothetical protein Srot_1524 [Segniliparus rotundus DSM 44985]